MKSQEILDQKEKKSSELSKMKWHHLVILEDVETKHQKSEQVEVTKWKSKQEQLNYMSLLEAKFDELKNKGWSNKQILRVYPDLALLFMDDKSKDEGE
jgi:hypothetical protein